MTASEAHELMRLLVEFTHARYGLTMDEAYRISECSPEQTVAATYSIIARATDMGRLAVEREAVKMQCMGIAITYKDLAFIEVTFRDVFTDGLVLRMFSRDRTKEFMVGTHYWVSDKSPIITEAKP